MSSNYQNTSPWFTTSVVNNYLDVMSIRSVSSQVDDFLYTIQPQYTYRPDLLAFDLYGDPNLWWVFTQRNMDVLQDPIFDFVPGTKIYIPKNSGLKTVLGI
jgi:Base plate wedge protein 53